ncbi:hypothetical protein ACH42_01130 [Endozoicomonas sp. (ex Bugula neritina AB1)]|nr:hypothetical protein ACH42_01130 [Endozoicomonas sp. (ex Bugula neritina AB1)]
MSQRFLWLSFVCFFMVTYIGAANVKAASTSPDATCSKTQFTCNDGSCVSGDSVCNLHRDCADGSDEGPLACKSCPTYGKSKCETGNFCLSSDFLCDGIEDCIDGSDEAEKECGCPKGQSRCMDNEKCVPDSMWCDGVAQCSDASDENLNHCKDHYSMKPDSFLAACLPTLSKADCIDYLKRVTCDASYHFLTMTEKLGNTNIQIANCSLAVGDEYKNDYTWVAYQGFIPDNNLCKNANVTAYSPVKPFRCASSEGVQLQKNQAFFCPSAADKGATIYCFQENEICDGTAQCEDGSDELPELCDLSCSNDETFCMEDHRSCKEKSTFCDGKDEAICFNDENPLTCAGFHLNDITETYCGNDDDCKETYVAIMCDAVNHLKEELLTTDTSNSVSLTQTIERNVNFDQDITQNLEEKVYSSSSNVVNKYTSNDVVNEQTSNDGLQIALGVGGVLAFTGSFVGATIGVLIINRSSFYRRISSSN